MYRRLAEAPELLMGHSDVFLAHIQSQIFEFLCISKVVVKSLSQAFLHWVHL